MPREELELRECFVTENTNIVQSNFLIERKQRLSLPATQLLYTLTGMINKDDEDLKIYKVDVTYFADLWGIDLKLAYQTVADTLTELNSKGIRTHSTDPQTGKKRFSTVGFISKGDYVEGAGYAEIRIDPDLKPHYIALKNRFTRFSLNNILQLQENGGQVNAMRTYELLKQYQKKGKRKFAVKEYKEQLGLIVYNEKGKFVKEKYKGSIANLKIKVLDPAIEKINNSTDIEAEYRITGRGSKAVIEFTIRANEKNLMAFSSESAKNEAPDQTSEDGDFTVNPNKKTFANEYDRELYISNYIDTVCSTSIERLGFEEIPEEVHNYEIPKIRALIAIIEKHIVLNFDDYYEPDENDYMGSYKRTHEAMEEAKYVRIEGAIKTFNTQEYNIRKKDIVNQKATYTYYRNALEGWTKENKEEFN